MVTTFLHMSFFCNTADTTQFSFFLGVEKVEHRGKIFEIA